MKSRTGAFANSNTGYSKSVRRSNQFNQDSKKNDKNELKEKQKKSELAKEINNADLNSGFGDYLRSSEAAEMMKIFVFANSIMLIVTMAWPNIKEHYYIIRHWLSSFLQE